jgi:hypothetical protein
VNRFFGTEDASIRPAQSKNHPRLSYTKGTVADERLVRRLVAEADEVYHLAAAVGIRCVGIFSARDFPGSWYPYGPDHLVLRAKVACEGCKLIGCHHDLACLKLISVGDVVKACDKALNNESSNKLEN